MTVGCSLGKDSPQPTKTMSSAWLECGDERIEIHTAFCIGRSNKCDYVIVDSKISRRHALFQFDKNDTSWLISDLGSKNVVYVNQVKIAQPVVLRRGDKISIGDVRFVFQMKQGDDIAQTYTISGEETMIAMDIVPCWILLADVKDSTRLSQSMPQSELSEKIRVWAEECEQIIQSSQGVLNEHLGDGILAFWRENGCSSQSIVDMLEAFNTLESSTKLQFRIILHHGILQIGGGVSSGLEKLAGKELNYIFRMEKSASEPERKISVTLAAKEQLESILNFQNLGQFQLKGFDDEHALFAPIFD